MRDWIKETEDHLHQLYARICERENIRPNFNIKPDLSVEEAEYFIRGLEENLFTIDDEGYVQSAFLPPHTKGSKKQRMTQFFWRKGDSKFLFREGINQVAVASSLVLKYGWNNNSVKMEPNIAEFEDLAYAVDFFIKDETGKIPVCGEAKRNKAEFNNLINGFRSCCERAPHTKADCLFPKNHAKYQFCARYKPAYFFATAPNQQICFSLSHDDGVHIKAEMTELPTPQMLSGF